MRGPRNGDAQGVNGDHLGWSAAIMTLFMQLIDMITRILIVYAKGDNVRDERQVGPLRLKLAEAVLGKRGKSIPEDIT